MNYKMMFLTLLLSGSFVALNAMSTDTSSTSTSSDSSSSSSSSSSDSDWGNTGWAGFQRERNNSESESGY